MDRQLMQVLLLGQSASLKRYKIHNNYGDHDLVLQLMVLTIAYQQAALTCTMHLKDFRISGEADEPSGRAHGVCTIKALVFEKMRNVPTLQSFFAPFCCKAKSCA